MPLVTDEGQENPFYDHLLLNSRSVQDLLHLAKPLMNRSSRVKHFSEKYVSHSYIFQLNM